MKKFVAMLAIAFTSLSLTACENMTNQDVGTVTGGVIGGILGSTIGGGSGQLVAIGAGTLAGALIGGQVGRNMDVQDRAIMNRAFENNAVGQPAYWQNQRTGAAYDVVPTQNVMYDGNPYCREYHSNAMIAGKSQQVYGTACRQPDGSWQVMNGN
jgi:surface antigen